MKVPEFMAFLVQCLQLFRFRDNARRKRVRLHLIEARQALEFPKHYPYFTCDVCGPYGHTFTLCTCAAEKAIKAFLYFHNHEPKEYCGLQRLVTLAALEAPEFEGSMDAVLVLYRYISRSEDDFSWMPSSTDIADAIQRAEQIIEFASSQLPEGVRL